MILAADKIDIVQRQLLTTFLEKSSRSIPLDSVEKLYLRLACTGYPLPDHPGLHDGWSDIDFTLNTRDDYVGGPFFIRLNLPTELPDDHHNQTKVELLP